MPYKSLGLRAAWSEEDLKRAVSLVIVNGKSNVQASKKFGIPLETLRRKVLIARAGGGVQKKLGRPTVMSAEDENQLAVLILQMESQLYGLSPVEVRRVVYQYCVKNNIQNDFNEETKMAGRYWLDGFLSRHEEISIRQAEPTSIHRAIGFNKAKVEKFFDVLRHVLFIEDENRKIPPENIYNVDESGFTICQKTGKILAKKGKKSVGQLTSAEKGKTVTSVCCISAAGVYVPPMLIFPRAKLKPSLMDQAPAGSVAAANKSGWISEPIFTKWFHHFINFVRPRDRPDPVLVLMDGHASHTANLEVIDLAKANNVILLVLPSHCTHRLQPLDLSFFKALNSYYNNEIITWLRNHQGRSVGEEQIAGLFAAAYGKAATVNNAVKGFEKAGIHPFRDDIFTDEDFAAAAATDRPQFEDSGNYTTTSPSRNAADVGTEMQPSAELDKSPVASQPQQPPTKSTPLLPSHESLVMEVTAATQSPIPSQQYPSEVRTTRSFLGSDSNIGPI